MQKQRFRKDLLLLILAFIVSRIIIAAFGVHMEYRTLFENWQYLDIETLRHHLWQGVWYDHAQPPVFNLFLGIVLKLTGSHAQTAFVLIFKAFTLANTFLLYALLARLAPGRYIPLLVSLLYLLSPATMIFESELFYTSFITFFLLVSAWYLFRLSGPAGLSLSAALRSPTGPPPAAGPSPFSPHSAVIRNTTELTSTFGFFLPLVVVCLTRSMYHLVWLAAISIILLFFARHAVYFRKLLGGALLSLTLVTVWYAKNLVIFHQFSTSSWVGMNLARNVFHDHPITDSSHIEAYEPFSDISTYRRFIQSDARQRYAGLNDRDLLQEKKNDTIKNVDHIDYIEISKKYNAASMAYIKAHPSIYMKNVALSAIMFFATATRYPHEEYQAKKIRWYDLLYSFNYSHFVSGKGPRRITLLLSAVPKLILYVLVFFTLLRPASRPGSFNLLNIFIFSTIAYVFAVSSLLEHYENMRFRYEIEPLFLLLLGQAIRQWYDTLKKPKNT